LHAIRYVQSVSADNLQSVVVSEALSKRLAPYNNKLVISSIRKIACNFNTCASPSSMAPTVRRNVCTFSSWTLAIPAPCDRKSNGNHFGIRPDSRALPGGGAESELREITGVTQCDHNSNYRTDYRVSTRFEQFTYSYAAVQQIRCSFAPALHIISHYSIFLQPPYRSHVFPCLGYG
jgi:hypothetical protein